MEPQIAMPTWEPPVIEAPAAEESAAHEEPQSAADIFFMQYVICILLLTTLLLLRLCDEGAFQDVTQTFRTQTQAPTLPWVESLLAMVSDLWS